MDRFGCYSVFVLLIFFSLFSAVGLGIHIGEIVL